jgi:hypothetical protein
MNNEVLLIGRIHYHPAKVFAIFYKDIRSFEKGFNGGALQDLNAFDGFSPSLQDAPNDEPPGLDIRIYRP